ncbi:MAG: hypothetical protein QXT28_12475 [Thermofilaceae archaeon]
MEMEEELILELIPPPPTTPGGLLPPERVPPPPPQVESEYFFFHLLFYDARDPKTRISVPAVVYALYPLRLAARLLRAAVAAAEVYILLKPWGFTPWGKPSLPKEWKIGAAIFGHNDVVACSILHTEGSFLTFGAVRGPEGWLVAKTDLSEWERAWAIGEPPTGLVPFTLPPEPLDSAVAEALQRAAPPPSFWLNSYKREVGEVENEVIGVEGWRLTIPSLYLP